MSKITRIARKVRSHDHFMNDAASLLRAIEIDRLRTNHAAVGRAIDELIKEGNMEDVVAHMKWQLEHAQKLHDEKPYYLR